MAFALVDSAEQLADDEWTARRFIGATGLPLFRRDDGALWVSEKLLMRLMKPSKLDYKPLHDVRSRYSSCRRDRLPDDELLDQHHLTGVTLHQLLAHLPRAERKPYARQRWGLDAHPQTLVTLGFVVDDVMAEDAGELVRAARGCNFSHARQRNGEYQYRREPGGQRVSFEHWHQMIHGRRWCKHVADEYLAMAVRVVVDAKAAGLREWYEAFVEQCESDPAAERISMAWLEDERKPVEDDEPVAMPPVKRRRPTRAAWIPEARLVQRRQSL